MFLNDSEIKRINTSIISPFDPKKVQPASYDLSLSNNILIPRKVDEEVDLRSTDFRPYMDAQSIYKSFVLRSGKCILGSTIETVSIPVNMIARVEGKSSLGRIFMAVHVTAGFLDPAFSGNITLEIVNLGPWDIVLYPGMPIAQIAFSFLVGKCDVPYGDKSLGSHYQNQNDVTPAAGKRGY